MLEVMKVDCTIEFARRMCIFFSIFLTEIRVDNILGLDKIESIR